MIQPSPARPGGPGIWIQACRPKTLGAALAPVCMGGALAGAGLHGPTFLVILLCTISIQIGTNLANDYFDYHKGADQGERLGPVRITQAGLATPQAVRRAFIALFLLALALGALLLWRGGWPIFVIGSLSLLFGVLYTGGPWPLAYLGLAEPFAFAFFGPVAVVGTHYLLPLSWSTTAWLAGIGPGLLSVALLAVNNLRDRKGDALAGKRTTAVRFGPTFARVQITLCLLGAALVPVGLVLFRECSAALLLASLGLLPGLRVLGIVYEEEGRPLNRALAAMGLSLVGYGLLFSLGALL